MTKCMRVPGRAVALTVALGACASLAGCGDRPGFASTAVGTVQYDGPALGKGEIVGAMMEAARSAGSAHVTTTMSGDVELSVRGAFSYGRHGVQSSSTMKMPDGRKVLARYVAGRLFVQVPGLVPPGKFAAIDPRDTSSPLARSLASTSEQMDPLAALESMGSRGRSGAGGPAVSAVRRVGKGVLDGETVEHYQITVDTAVMRAQLSRAQRAVLPDSLSYDMWLDDRDLVRRISVVIADVTMDTRFSRWGEPVTVRRPAARDLAALPTT